MRLFRRGLKTLTERSMKPILAASPALLLAGAMLAAPASAQTMAHPDLGPPMGQPYAGAAAQPSAMGETAANPELNQAPLPRGSYLGECKDVRMLQDTLTAFCPRGDGTWQTSQLQNASSCPGGVQNAAGDLICALPSGTGSTNPEQNYGSASGASYGTAAPAPPGNYGAYGTGPQPTATSTYPSMPSQGYAAPPPVYAAPSPAYGAPPAYAAPPPAYGAPGPYTYAPYPAYPAPEGTYAAPSATRPAQPPY
jgi:hypothetical protein